MAIFDLARDAERDYFMSADEATADLVDDARGLQPTANALATVLVAGTLAAAVAAERIVRRGSASTGRQQ